MLSRCCIRARRAAGSVLALSPNSCSKAALGETFIGSGEVASAHEIVPVYTQLRPKSQLVPESTDSNASSIDGNAVSLAQAFARIWSTETPARRMWLGVVSVRNRVLAS